MPRSVDRDLRRLVARLSRLGAADRELVLSSLKPAQLQEVLALMAELQGVDVGDPPPAHARERDWAGMGLSPMMIARLDADDGSLEGPGRIEMTPAARDLLLDCADRLLPPDSERRPQPEPPSSWWTRLTRWGVWA